MYRSRSTPIDRNFLVSLFRFCPAEKTLDYILGSRHLGETNAWSETGAAYESIKKFQRELQGDKSLTELELPLKEAFSKHRLQIEQAEGHFPEAVQKPSVWNWPLYISNTYLEARDNHYWVKIEHALRWKQLTLQIPPDILICSFHASVRHKHKINKAQLPDLDWPIQLPIFHTTLWKELKSQELVDNHAHYIACPDPVMPAWISFMNRIVDRHSDLHEAKLYAMNLQSTLVPEPGIHLLNWEEKLTLAAGIRFVLAGLVKNPSLAFPDSKLFGSTNLDDENVGQRNDGLFKFPLTFLRKVYNACLAKDEIGFRNSQKELQNHLDSFSFSAPLLRYKPGSANRALDYLLSSNLFHESGPKGRKGEEWLTLGERNLWTQLFEAYYNKEEWFLAYQDLFLAYLQIFTQFRAELIQSNLRVGFENFYEYQNRKDALLKSDPILQGIRKGLWLHSRLREKNSQILQLEKQNVRISAGKGNFFKEMEVLDFDLECAAYVGISPDDELKADFKRIGGYRKINQKIKRRLSVVPHFIKKPDENDALFYGGAIPNSVKLGFDLECRHFEMRQKVKEQAISMAIWLKYCNQESLALWKGPDAASNELHCRNEVFAQAMRFLRGQRPLRFPTEGLAPTSRILSHAGEEIFDLLDGLRYIDETIRFQGLRGGDSIGHALALGTDARLFYEAKGYRTDLTLQNYLDNLAWALSMAHRLDVSMSSHLQGHLMAEFSRVFYQVFGSKSVCDVELYYSAWKLRGDNPEVYKTAYDRLTTTTINLPSTSQFPPNEWEYYNFAQLNTEDAGIRQHPDIYDLIHRYHYSKEVRQNGLRVVHLKIERDLLGFILQLQKAMARKISGLGIFIETLPSVNLAISPIDRYEDHPIIKFLPVPGTDGVDKDFLQHTSINTDNSGVCHISLENEYALMFRALQKRKNENGERLHSDSEILAWVRELIRQGRQQA